MFMYLYFLHSDITALAKNEAYAWISLDKYCIYQVFSLVLSIIMGLHR